MILQIRGEARNAIENLEETKWQIIRDRLRDYFSYLVNKDIINSKLENLRQEKHESLNTFVDRTRKILREKNSMYMGLSEDQKLEHNRIARRAFAKGIADPKLRNRLLIRGANSLEDAIAYSIEAETDLLQEISSRELICMYCRLTGHREMECRKKEQGGNGLNNLISALQTLNIRDNDRRINLPPRNRQRQYNGNMNRNDRPFSRNSGYGNNNYNKNWNNYNKNWNNSNNYTRSNENLNNNMNENNQNNRNDQQRNYNQNSRRNENRNNSQSFTIRNFYFDLDSENSSDTSCQTLDFQSEN